MWLSKLIDILADTTEVKGHIHTRERWFGKKAAQTATDWADAGSLALYRAVSGNGDFGSDANDEAQVLGSDDTPVIVGKTLFDPHRLVVCSSSVATPYILRVVWGTGTMADAITAEQYSDVVIQFDNYASVPVELRTPRLAAGTKVWIQAKNATDNATIDFYMGVHEY